MGQLWKVFIEHKYPEICLETGDWFWLSGLGHSVLGLDFPSIEATVNSLRVQTSYKKQIWCAWPGKVALPFILEAAGTSSGVGCHFRKSL